MMTIEEYEALLAMATLAGMEVLWDRPIEGFAGDPRVTRGVLMFTRREKPGERRRIAVVTYHGRGDLTFREYQAHLARVVADGTTEAYFLTVR